MLIGLCTSAVSGAATIATSGIDYVEENVQSFLAPEGAEADFSTRLDAALGCHRPLSVANCFLPGDLTCVGPGVNEARMLAYARQACRRAARSGIGIIVFGSGGARSLPPGLSAEAALGPFCALLTRLGEIARAQGVVLALEPLNRHECNFITTIAEGVRCVRLVDHAHVRLLVDIFHMLRNDEPPEEILAAKDLVVHAHVAERENRRAPGTHGEDLRGYLRALHAIGYDRRLSFECGWTDCFSELPQAIAVLKRQLQESGYA